MRRRGRRDVLRASIAMSAVGASWVLGCGGKEEPRTAHDTPRVNPTGPDEISPTEDLMREHGLLNRLLLLYDECGRRLEANIELRADVIPSTARIFRSFVHAYHEKLEEDHVFPRFEQALTH